ncbi:hypothetical protein FO519_004163 [Halicephalobus sp. NKZ332]|nr:hypothetical protein FO519_004163 [Halicephalobus sp. NKZ332]
MAGMNEIAMGNDQSQSEMKFVEEHVQMPEDGEIFDEQDEEKAGDPPVPSFVESKIPEGLILEKPKEELRCQPPGWRRRALCKFFRRGFCQNGPSCVYSHNAADSRRAPVLCRFYADGFCKSGAECNLLHGEFPCKNFHKGLCKDRYCRYSHEPLNEFTQPIYDEMLEEEALIANMSISFEPRKRKVLLPTPQCGVPQKPVKLVVKDSTQPPVVEEGGLFSGMLEEMSKTTPDTFPRDENWRICATFLQKKVYKLILAEQPAVSFDQEFVKKLNTEKFISDPRINSMLKKAEEKREQEPLSPPVMTKCDPVQDPRLSSTRSPSCDSRMPQLPSVTHPEPVKDPFTIEKHFVDQVRMRVTDAPKIPIKVNRPPSTEATEVGERTIVARSGTITDPIRSTEAEGGDMVPMAKTQKGIPMIEIEEDGHPTDVPSRVITFFEYRNSVTPRLL